VTVKLSTTLDKLKTSISNEESKEVIQRFFDFMKKIGTSERYQNNNLKEFGNVKPQFRGAGFGGPNILSERQLLSEVVSTDKEVKVTVELPGVSKEQIKIDAYDERVEIRTENANRKYHEVVDLPS
jgi:HSP20 family molecular chaperone IbpA